MSFRGAAFLVADGKTQPVNDEFFQRLGGGYDGGIGATASWALAAMMCAAMAFAVFNKRRNRSASACRAIRCGWTCWCWRCR